MIWSSVTLSVRPDERRALYRRALGLPEVQATEVVFPNGGTFLHLDGGTLDLGIVRDAVTDSSAEYTVFSETFEQVARIKPPGQGQTG